GWHTDASQHFTVDVPARFRNSKAIGPSLGLTPVLNQSGESHRVGRISLCGDEAMRALLYEAAQVMLARVQKWSWLKAWETLLRANGIDTLVLAGVHTSGVVLSTVRYAGDLDYRL